MGKFIPPRVLGMRRLRAILAAFGCEIDLNRGKGGHWCARRLTSKGWRIFPFPSDREVYKVYHDAARRKLMLMPEDGVSDERFYGAG